MGTRGPVKGTGGRPTLRKLPTLVPARSPSLPTLPDDLNEAGRDVWRRVWEGVPWLDADQHGQVVDELARLTDELAAYRSAITAHGPLVAEPIVTPKGEVVGERLVPNPAEAMARRAGAALERLWGVLGLTPAARVRLGLSHLEARRLAERSA